MDDLFLYYGVLFLAISLYFIGYYCKILGDFVTHKEYNKISKNYINYLLRLLFVICVIGCGFIMIYKDEFLIYFSHIALPIYCIFINSIRYLNERRAEFEETFYFGENVAVFNYINVFSACKNAVFTVG